MFDHGVGAGWSSLVARRAHNPKVVGSNPAPATNLSIKQQSVVRSLHRLWYFEFRLVEEGNAVDTPNVFYEDIASGLMQHRGAPFWGFSLEERKWAEAHFLLGDLNGCVR